MSKSRRLLVVCLMLVSYGAIARTKAQSPKVTAPNVEQSVDDRLREKRLLSVIRVMKFADRALSFKDLTVKVLTISQLADLLWDDDQPYSRQLFVKALDTCNNQKDSDQSTERKLTVRGIASLRRQVIGYISRRDVSWAKELIDAGTVAEREAINSSQANIETAYDLARNSDIKSASEFAERSLETGVSPWIVGVLVEIRRSDPTRADLLFVQVLDRLGTGSGSDLDTFSYLGTYLFTSPRVNPEDPAAAVQVIVGSNLLWDITVDRPKISPALVRAYIQTAIALIGRSKTDRESSLSYAIGYLLFSKARKYAPDLAPILTATMQSIAARVAPELLQTAAYKNFEPPQPLPFDEAIAEIEKLPLQNQRDEKYFSLLASLWQKKQYGSARLAAKRLSDSNEKDQVEAVIDFGEASDVIARSDIRKAQRIAEGMPRGIETSLVWLGIARSQLRAKQLAEAVEATNRAMNAVSSLIDARRGYVLIEIAGLMAKLNAGNGMAVLHDAIREFNSRSPSEQIEWRRTIKIGKVTRVFPLTMQGFNGSITDAVANLVALDADSLVSEVSELKQEQQAAKLMTAVSAVFLRPESKKY